MVEKQQSCILARIERELVLFCGLDDVQCGCRHLRSGLVFVFEFTAVQVACVVLMFCEMVYGLSPAVSARSAPGYQGPLFSFSKGLHIFKFGKLIAK